MSSTPPETETYDVELSRDQRWIVHHVLTKRLEYAADNDETPPTWVLEVLETIESGGTTITANQGRRLYGAISDYVDDGGTPERDVSDGSAALDHLKAALPDIQDGPIER
ncbi:hypothetical protein ACFQGT_06700 [Natrialbaceae archaeon GCM10025810]|uniref:DUF7853 family protein n=1 Tax=Halovalidus salilacus TaxID=3075124 RepID=UPI00361BC4D1